MSIDTFSLFYYGHTVTSDTSFLNFDESSGELTAEIQPSGYSAEELMIAVKTALDATGVLTYTVSFDRDSRRVTISAGSNFDLLISSGAQSGSSIFSLLGFNGADLTGASTYTGDSVCGDIYRPQFKLQDYISKDDWQGSVGGTVQTSSSGQVEVVRFGVETFYQGNFRFITDIPMGHDPIRTNPTGVADFRRFVQFITTKARFEFIPDESTTSIFDKLILESTPDNSDGIGYKLKERYDIGLPGIYDSGIYKFRVVA